MDSSALDSDQPLFEPVEFTSFTQLVSDCVEYSSQIIEFSKSEQCPSGLEGRSFDPVLVFSALIKAYKQAAPAGYFFCDQLAATSEPGASVESFADVTACSYHEVGLEIARLIFSTVAQTIDILFVDSFRPGEDGMSLEFQLFMPDVPIIPVDDLAIRNSLSTIPLFDRARLLAFLKKEAARIVSTRQDSDRMTQDNMTALPTETAVGTLATDEAGQSETEERAADSSTLQKGKRSSGRGEGRAKLIAALTKHHEYAEDSCLNLEPIGNNELARLAKVSGSTASAFFKEMFGEHAKYRAICSDATRLLAALKLLNQEFAPHHLFGAKPPGEGERLDEE